MSNIVDPVVLDPLISTIGWENELEDDVDVTRTRNKSESRKTTMPYLLKRFRVPFQQLNFERRKYLRDFVEGRVNRLFGFLMWDFENFRLVDVQIGVGDGAKTQFQLYDRRGDAVRSYLKPVTRPVPTGTAVPEQLQYQAGATATTTVKVAGVTKTEGVTYSIDPDTGVLTLTAAPGVGEAVVASLLFYTPARFDGPTVTFEVNGIMGAVQAEIVELYERPSV